MLSEIFRVRTAIKKASGGGSGVSIYCLGHHSLTIFRFLSAHFAIFFPHLPRA